MAISTKKDVNSGIFNGRLTSLLPDYLQPENYNPNQVTEQAELPPPGQSQFSSLLFNDAHNNDALSARFKKIMSKQEPQ